MGRARLVFLFTFRGKFSVTDTWWDRVNWWNWRADDNLRMRNVVFVLFVLKTWTVYLSHKKDPKHYNNNKHTTVILFYEMEKFGL